MKLWSIIISILVLIVLLAFHLFALMKMFPLYITSPLLFIAIYLALSVTTHKKTFRGFK